jgi:hypothetical protein
MLPLLKNVLGKKQTWMSILPNQNVGQPAALPPLISDIFSAKSKAGPSNKSSKTKNSKKQRVQGPADDVTDPKAITLLSGHTTEVVFAPFM